MLARGTAPNFKIFPDVIDRMSVSLLVSKISSNAVCMNEIWASHAIVMPFAIRGISYMLPHI